MLTSFVDEPERVTTVQVAERLAVPTDPAERVIGGST